MVSATLMMAAEATPFHRLSGWLRHLRQSWLAAPAILFLICCGFCWKLVLTNQYTWIDNPDLVNMDVPRLQFQAVAWRNHEFPLWDPHLWCGQPFLGEIVGAAYPLNWPLFLLRPNRKNQISFRQLNWYFVVLHFLGALFAYWLCRDLGISRAASVLGGFVFSFSGFFGLTRWPEVLSGILLAPLVLLFLLRALRRYRPFSNAALSGMFLGLSWLSGHHEIPIYLSMTVAFLWLYDLVWHRLDWRRSLALAFITALFTILTSGFQTVPGYEYAKQAVRWVGSGQPLEWSQVIPYRIHAQYSFSPSSLIAIVAPWGVHNTDAFAGIVVLSLAAIAVFACWRNRSVRLFSSIALAGLLLALGGWNLFHGILYAALPIFEKARNPSRLVALFSLGVAVLSAFGLDGLSLHVRTDTCLPLFRTIYRTSVALGVFILALGLAASALHQPDPDDLLMMLGLIATLFAVVLFARQNGSISDRTMTVAILALVCIELGNVSAAVYHDRTASDHRETWLPKLTEFRDIADFLRHQPGPVRLDAMEVTGMFNVGDWEGIDTLYGFGAGVTKNLRSLDWPSVRTQNLLAIGYSLSKRDPRPDQQAVFQGPNGVHVYRNVDALPRARIVHRMERSASSAELAARVNDASFDASRTALLLDAAPVLESCIGEEQVPITQYSANSVIIHARLACRGMVILADTWYPGWTAAVDGHAVPIYQPYLALRGVVLDRGEHRLEFHYRPASALIGAIMSALGILGACSLAVWTAMSAREASAPIEPL